MALALDIDFVILRPFGIALRFFFIRLAFGLALQFFTILLAFGIALPSFFTILLAFGIALPSFFVIRLAFGLALRSFFVIRLAFGLALRSFFVIRLAFGLALRLFFVILAFGIAFVRPAPLGAGASARPEHIMPTASLEDLGLFPAQLGDSDRARLRLVQAANARLKVTSIRFKLIHSKSYAVYQEVR